jgi:rhodanese-related sulfurtransferase
VRIVGRDEVLRLQEQGAAVVEVLPNEEYELEHIAGAVNLPLKELDGSVLTRFPKARTIVVYCNDSL